MLKTENLQTPIPGDTYIVFLKNQKIMPDVSTN